MSLVDPDALADQPCVRVYIAGRLREARAVEDTLTTAGLDYYVAIERFERLLLGLIRREYDGVAFYVRQTEAPRALDALRAGRFAAGLEEDA